jgi:hypothetical protein
MVDHLGPVDDERLRAIISGKDLPLGASDWRAIARQFGPGASVDQLQYRWHNYAKPGLDNGPFTLIERRQVAALAIEHPDKWKWIATQLGNGRCRSAPMAKNTGAALLTKLKKVGLDIQSGLDIEFVPDAVFDDRRLAGSECEEIRAQFSALKAQHTTSAAAHAAGARFGDGSKR